MLSEYGTYAIVEAAHEVLEECSKSKPGREVDSSGGWQDCNTGHHDGNVNIAPEGEGVAPGEVIERKGKEGTDKEEVHERVVEGTRAEKTAGADSTPHHRRSRKD